MHDTMRGTLNGFLHAAALRTSKGLRIRRFLDDAAASVAALLSSLPTIADEIDRGEHATPYGALQHHPPSLADLVRESRDRNIDDANCPDTPSTS